MTYFPRAMARRRAVSLRRRVRVGSSSPMRISVWARFSRVWNCSMPADDDRSASSDWPVVV
jgi:hypothetical protein